ncbi:hypothetical protein DFJ69_6282 [Thermomonospora umbrina]|uniref:Uncharacterized protein n=1 Tax=Thermomonospora umbrina TaxID=111806 RepID=A0A3D9SXM9_9ACTN|nr:hypothetical protein DFJ69_6282 [Thermomonospora umbrina]
MAGPLPRQRDRTSSPVIRAASPRPRTSPTANGELYDHLTAYAAANGRGLLLEQERILWTHAHATVITALYGL